MRILGIYDGHCATAAFLNDGRVSSVISEERLTYRKNEVGLPITAIRRLLELEKIEADQIDGVAFAGYSANLFDQKTKKEFSFTIKDWVREQHEFWKPKLYEGRNPDEYINRMLSEKRFNDPQAYDFSDAPLFGSNEAQRLAFEKMRFESLQKLTNIPRDRMTQIEHHRGHQYYAYYGSPFRGKPALVFTADGFGDGANGTYCTIQNDRLFEQRRNSQTDLARLYRYITLLLGMKPFEHEYKVMGLAPYASTYEVQKCWDVFKDLFEISDLQIRYKKRPRDLYFHFKEQLEHCRFDGIAGAVQQLVEEVVCDWIKQVVNHYGIHRVVFSGGLSMNVKLNKVIGELPEVHEFYCPASGGDESLAVGAAYALYIDKTNKTPEPFRNNYAGDEWTQAEIDKAIAKMNGVSVFPNSSTETLARYLANNRIVARFNGRMEFGARALGNRSILANPSQRENLKRINEKIKNRDFWMPFAPSILDSFEDRYLVNPKRIGGDHMTHAYETTELGRQHLVAAIHPADQTARAHIVRADVNQGYHDLISEFAHISGIGGLLNTSFNLHGLPIVGSPERAVHVFENSDIDAMAVGTTLVVRRGREL